MVIMDISKYPIAQRIRALGSEVWIWLLLVALLILIFAANTLYATTKAARFGGASTAASSLQVNSQRLASQAIAAVEGDAEAFTALEATARQIDNDLQRLRDNFGKSDLRGPIQTVAKRWTKLSKDAGQLLANEQAVLTLAKNAERFAQRLPQLQTQLDEVVRAMSADGVSSSQIYISLRQVVLADAMAQRIAQLRAGGAEATNARTALGDAVQQYQQVMDGLREGGNGEARRVPAAAATPLDQAYALWLEMKQNAEAVLATSTGLLGAQTAVAQLTAGSDPLLAESEYLFRALTAFGSLRDTSVIGGVWISILSGLLLLAGLVGLYFSIQRREPDRSQTALPTHDGQQLAFARLHDQIGLLANGDLTVQASANDSVAGAVADAINTAVSGLHERVQAIRRTAMQVEASAEQARAKLLQLTERADQQVQGIDIAADALRQHAATADQHMRDCVDMLAAAEHSVHGSKQSAGGVREMIPRMSAIQRQIEQSDQRIERLSGGLHEIAAMVALVDDLSEQTSLLALNVAIHAASTGATGGGLGSMANDAQRLAQGVSSAANRIETRMQLLQSDCQQARSTIRQSANEMAVGIDMVGDVGIALGEIERGSTKLAGYVERMSAAAQQQSSAVPASNAAMERIQSMAAQTKRDADHAAQSLDTLAQLVAELRGVVADFKLQDPL